MNALKEDCIDILIDYIFRVYEYEMCEAYKETDIYDAKNKIIEVANTTDVNKLEGLYEEIKKDYSI